MKAAVLKEFHEPVVIEEVPRPEPGPDEVLLRVHGCGVCHSDLHVAEADWDPLRRITKLPLILGHEIAGTVEIGSGQWEAGDRAGLPWLYWTCGECEYCQSGREPLCAKQRITGVTVDGGYAEYVVAKASHIVRIPDALGFVEAAPLFCAGLTVFRALNQSGISKGQSLAVFGVGGLGHLAVQLGKARGAEVTAVDIAEDKLELARRCGADAVVNTAAAAKPPRVDVAMVCAGSVAAYQTALNSLRRGGTLVVVGMPADPIPIPAIKLVGGEFRVISSAVGTREELKELLGMAADGKVRCHTAERPLGDAAAVLAEMKRGAMAGRIVLTP
jgi:propanol-preferring alcohol dehydrogenase